MSKKLISIIISSFAFMSVLSLQSCVKDENLGRSQLLLSSDKEVAKLSLGAWEKIKESEKIVTDPKKVKRVKKVMDRIIVAAGGNPEEWEVKIFESDSVNAFAMAGNRAGFFTGLLDFVESDDELAVIAGHEVAHVIYKHNVERYSQGKAKQLALGVAGILLGSNKNKDAILQGADIASNFLGLLPFSRFQEQEADVWGLRFMDMAGYDMDASIKFWEKMNKKSGSVPEFLSTHPSAENRAEKLREEISKIRASKKNT